MSKFHINPESGEAGKCSATKGGCPFGGDSEHFTSVEAARAQNEKNLAEANGWGSTKREPLSPEIKALMAEITKLANSPARHFNFFPEDEMGRHNIEKKLEEKRDRLRSMLPDADFLQLRASVTAADHAYGLEQVAVLLATNDEKYSWESIMGDTRRTAKAIEQYETFRRNAVRDKPKLHPAVLKYAEKHRDQNVFARAYEQNLGIPKQYEDAFEEAWADPKLGEKGLIEKLEGLEKMKADYAAGKLTATNIVGGGLRNPKLIADEYLVGQEAFLKRAIKTRGRSYGGTVANVMYRARQESWPYARQDE